MNKAERCHAAMDYRRQGLNCSQCLLAAFRDRAGLTVDQAVALGAGMGGGDQAAAVVAAGQLQRQLRRLQLLGPQQLPAVQPVEPLRKAPLVLLHPGGNGGPVCGIGAGGSQQHHRC